MRVCTRYGQQFSDEDDPSLRPKLDGSDKLLVAPGLWVFPGGHPEPSVVGIDNWGSAEMTAHDADAAQMSLKSTHCGSASTKIEQCIRDEIFDSVKREVMEEVGVTENDLRQNLFLGVVKRTKGAHYNTAFVVRCVLSSDEIIARYHTPGAAVDASESSRIMAVPIADLQARTADLAMPGLDMTHFFSCSY